MAEDPKFTEDASRADPLAGADPAPAEALKATDSAISLADKIRHLPKNPGVYLFKDAQGRVLYVGKAKDLRSRVGSYFQDSADLLKTRGPEIARMVGLVTDIEFLECETEVDALLKENRLIKDIQPPYNERLRDDKTFPYLEITTSEDFPGVYVTRKPRLKGSKLYGPFTSAAGLRDAVNAMQKVFKFRTCELDIREGDESRRHFRPCLLHAINQCTAPCADLISREAYREDIERLRKFLASKRSVVLRDLQKEMEVAAAERRYEDAARLRDRIKALQALSLSGDPEADRQHEVFYIDPTQGLERLREVLELDAVPRTLEGIDIANLHGEESCGSLVCFIDGRPFKSGYKRFRIKTVEGIDDYAMIREVVTRRYRHAAGGEELYPDVILIDGGLGQLHAALGAFADMDLRPPMVISLAKREEEIYIQARTRPIRLPRNDAALRLLQQVRDEAHRFAQHYHHLLRRKRLFDEDVAAGQRPPRRNSPRSKNTN
ncbi:MAG TPA: excinuclease ABC subunit UvrC [Phycisphaerae bacterium]|jgi:excinuclease ABC subunit C|nr:excinuclease ABC subunit UvrC [Phycisphaerae bacterium]HPU31807.1 excinuclease ABC subunit UvrC [Phycisphaerae bacterium]HQA46184.1 excinuclease ABC subunit UvrC [Phycisphaerae bacterium]HQE45464.1 excinuclease ABC subunit UvrC [Phycisphaerae bacterium]HXK87762.1 excinuclease ABC subunit UvrC [Phycisphaerae bacterium]